MHPFKTFEPADIACCSHQLRSPLAARLSGCQALLIGGDQQRRPLLTSPSFPRTACRDWGRFATCRVSTTHVRDAIRAVEKIKRAKGAVDEMIMEQMGKCLTESDLGIGQRTVGKVRDVYDLGDRVVIITTDRQSAFDRILASVPFKGQVLNQISAWWMAHTKPVVPNALLAIPHPNAAIMRKCQVFPVEFVVRGYMTGSTDTSLWTHYNGGARTYCGHRLPDGMRKNDRLAENLVTPTTKAADHDVPISAHDIVGQGLMSSHHWKLASEMALTLFEEGQREAASRGLLLVDTKYEFGLSPQGEVLLIDEIHTPDSSRYWLADSYAEQHAAGAEPHSIDKEFLRLWFKDNCDPYNDKVLPEAPEELVMELSRRYILLYETITDEIFSPTKVEHAELKAAVRATLHTLDMERAKVRARARRRAPEQQDQH